MEIEDEEMQATQAVTTGGNREREATHKFPGQRSQSQEGSTEEEQQGPFPRFPGQRLWWRRCLWLQLHSRGASSNTTTKIGTSWFPDISQAQTLGKTLQQKIHQHTGAHSADYEASWAWNHRRLLTPTVQVDLTLTAASRGLGAHITVLVEEDGKFTPIQMRSDNSKAATLVLHLKANHYQAALPEAKRLWPIKWTDLANALAKVPRRTENKEPPATPSTKRTQGTPHNNQKKYLQHTWLVPQEHSQQHC